MRGSITPLTADRWVSFRAQLDPNEQRKVFDAVLEHLCGEFFLKDGELHYDTSDRYRSDSFKATREIEPDYDVIHAACTLRDVLKSDAALKGLSK